MFQIQIFKKYFLLLQFLTFLFMNTGWLKYKYNEEPFLNCSFVLIQPLTLSLETNTLNFFHLSNKRNNLISFMCTVKSNLSIWG